MEEQPPAAPKCSRNHCNYFNIDAIESLKSLIPYASVGERNLLVDVARIVEKNGKSFKRKDDLRKVVAEALSSLGYGSCICESKWGKSSCCPAGEYEFINAIVEDERLIVDVDFRSEFEIARSTGTYKVMLQSLPFIFVGKSERLARIVAIVFETTKQSLKKKGMHVPPWRKRDYLLEKLLSPSSIREKEKKKQPRPPPCKSFPCREIKTKRSILTINAINNLNGCTKIVKIILRTKYDEKKIGDQKSRKIKIQGSKSTINPNF